VTLALDAQASVFTIRGGGPETKDILMFEGRRLKRRIVAHTAAVLLLSIAMGVFSTGAHAEETEKKGAGDLAAASQNPIANMISLPFQNNTFFGIGKNDEEANVLNIQPVYPISAGDWNIITRTIAPIIYIPDPTDGIEHLPNHDRPGDTFGLGDINFSAYFSPARPGKFIWGVGPSLTVPSATDDTIGSEKWSVGPAAVVLVTPKPWVIGGLVRNLWSFAGDSGRPPLIGPV
jgi:hypothetical protein